jgi:hypothetical protein
MNNEKPLFSKRLIEFFNFYFYLCFNQNQTSLFAKEEIIPKDEADLFYHGINL